MEAAGQGGRATLKKDPGAQRCGAAITTMLHMHKLLSQRETIFRLGAPAILALSQQPNHILINIMSLSSPFQTAESETLRRT